MNANEIDENKYLQNSLLLQLEKLTGIAPADVPIDDEKAYRLLTSPAALGVTAEEIESPTGTAGIPELDSKFMQSALRVAKANSFDDLVKLAGLSRGRGTWNDNAEHLLQSGERIVSELIASREDITELLEGKGVEKERALDIVLQIYRNEVHENGFDPADESLLRSSGVPDWYIDSCKKIQYLSPRASTISKVNVSARLLWFKLYHPLAFYAVVLEAEKSKILQREKEGDSVDFCLKTFAQLENEYRCRGFDFLPVELGKSLAVDYKIEDGSLRLPYISIDGIGINFAYRLEVKAELKENYTSYRDVNKKIGLNMVVMDALEQAGLLTGMSAGTKYSI